MNKLDKLGDGDGNTTKYTTQQSTTPSEFAEGEHREVGACLLQGWGVIDFNTLRYPYKNGYLMAYPPGRVSDSRGNLRSPTHKKTATQQSTNIGQQLQASVMVQEGPKDKYNAQKSK